MSVSFDWCNYGKSLEAPTTLSSWSDRLVSEPGKFWVLKLVYVKIFLLFFKVKH